MIKFLDLYNQDRNLHSKILKDFKKIFIKGDFILGEEVVKFEKNFSKFCNSKYAISCANGTDAITIALKSLNLKNKNFIPNKYISKSLIHVYAQKMNHRNDLIYFYLHLVHTNTYDKNTINELLRLDKNTLNVFIKTFNFYYNSKIKWEKIYKLLDKWMKK